MNVLHAYSALDRAVHRLAYSSPAVQETAADIEGLVYGSRFRHLTIERPIFVTSLPRAGTTLLLEILSQIPGLATHTYRDMPFVLAPILWDSMTRGFRRPAVLQERAHGDGMDISYDSPEAFEEVLWKAAWPAKYHPDHIELWSPADADAAEFGETFADHMKRIVALRTNGMPGARYLSKNNANVARIGLLRSLFSDCIVLVPVRHPVAQAASLLEQHRLFADLHAQDDFARRYMEDIGHLEFGQLHRPISFPGMEDVRRAYGIDTLDYWVAYWECAFRHVLQNRTDVVLISYDELCGNSGPILPSLAKELLIDAAALQQATGTRLRPPRRPPDEVKDRALARRVADLYEALLDASVGRAGHGR